MRRIFREALEQGLPEPTIEEIGLHLRLTIFLTQPITTEQISSRAETKHNKKPESRLESRLESKLAARVFLLLAENEAGKAKLARHLGHKTVSGELHKQIRHLLDNNLIEMTLPDTPSSRLQRYRLTEQGLTMMAAVQAALAKK